MLWTADAGELDQAVQGELTQQAVALLSRGRRPGRARGRAGRTPVRYAGQRRARQQSPVVVAEDGTAAFVAVPVTSSSATDNIDKVEELREDLRDDAPDGVTVEVTGPAGIQADIGQVFDGADFRLLRRHRRRSWPSC